MEKNYEIAELICLKCFDRWIGVYNLPLKELECKCGARGYIIKTGQTIESKQCDLCQFNNNGGCKLRLSGNDAYCEYYKEKK